MWARSQQLWGASRAEGREPWVAATGNHGAYLDDDMVGVSLRALLWVFRCGAPPVLFWSDGASVVVHKTKRGKRGQTQPCLGKRSLQYIGMTVIRKSWDGVGYLWEEGDSGEGEEDAGI